MTRSPEPSAQSDARPPAPATGKVLAAGASAGIAAAAAWATLAVVFPPIPANARLALALMVTAMIAAVAAHAGPGGDVRRGALAALCAGTVASLLIVLSVVLLSTFGPASIIPDLAPAALTPADDLAQSRNEIQDPYVVILFLSCPLAVSLSIASVVTRRRSSTAVAR